jgi:hypothetical protein
VSHPAADGEATGGDGLLAADLGLLVPSRNLEWCTVVISPGTWLDGPPDIEQSHSSSEEFERWTDRTVEKYIHE